MLRKGQVSGTAKPLHGFVEKVENVTTNSGFHSRFCQKLISIMPVYENLHSKKQFYDKYFLKKSKTGIFDAFFLRIANLAYMTLVFR